MKNETINIISRAEVIKAMSFAIGHCGSIKPEKQAEAALKAIEAYAPLQISDS